jgi:hypothetical protein
LTRAGFSKTEAEAEVARPAKSKAWRMEVFLFIIEELFFGWVELLWLGKNAG